MFSPYPFNEFKPWGPFDEWLLQWLAAAGTTTPEIAQALGRSVHAVRGKASQLGITLYPKDSHPFLTWVYNQGNFGWQ